MPTLHPQAQAMLDAGKAAGGPPLYEMTVPQAREMMAMVAGLIGPGPELASVSDFSIDGSGRTIAARSYFPGPDAPGVVVYLHSGGWVLGTLDGNDALCRKLALASGLEVVAVDYAKAPEHPYPAAIEDVDAALAWVSEHIAAGRPLIVMGESSGATLATVAARHARDTGGPAVAMQVLVCPMTDLDSTTDSYAQFGNGEYINGAKDMDWFFSFYVPDPHQRAGADIAPLQAKDFSGLPPAIVLLAHFDALADEGRAYADALAAAGVTVDLLVAEDMGHAFLSMVNLLEVADRYVVDIGARLAAQVAAA
jgi:acetyl esterase